MYPKPVDRLRDKGRFVTPKQAARRRAIENQPRGAGGQYISVKLASEYANDLMKQFFDPVVSGPKLLSIREDEQPTTAKILAIANLHSVHPNEPRQEDQIVEDVVRHIFVAVINHTYVVDENTGETLLLGFL